MECEHCFVYSNPNAKGTFTLDQIRKVLVEATKIGTIEIVYFEGGEPFMFYPIMLQGLKLARECGFKTGIVTNSYWATNDEDIELWLAPLLELGVSDFSISDDLYHYENEIDNPSNRILSVAKRLGMPSNSICIEKPKVSMVTNESKGLPVVDGGALLRGRAVEKLTEDLPKFKYDEFKECTEEELRNPNRVHLDSYGYVHICQGLVLGNMWKTPLSELVGNYNADKHPICGPLLKGGPALLAKKYGIKHEDKYISACHFCYLVRLALLDRFPEYLAPRQIYGLK
jgi:hypothetical protein